MPDTPPLAIFTHRPPSAIAVGAGGSGLLTAVRTLRPAHTVWFAAAAEQPPDSDVTVETVHLDHELLRDHEAGFAKRTLWPLLHYLVEQPVVDRGWWDAYQQANERFADHAATLATEIPRWIHDYRLMLLPGLLREHTPGAPISYFVHTPWPPPELFARLPWREALLEGLLGADVISFQTPAFRDNFRRTCDGILGTDAPTEEHVVARDGRRVRLAVNPASVDAPDLALAAASPPVERAWRGLREQFAGRRILLGVDPLDYTKGILARLEVFEHLLEHRPDLRGRLALVQIAVPSHSRVREYRTIRHELDEAIGRINGAYTEPGGEVPVHYVRGAVDRDELLAHYRAADMLLVTSLADGMNLIVKEFVVTQAATRTPGMVVLSEFAGAADELVEAQRCNPFDVVGLARRITDTLEIGPTARRLRTQKMAQTVWRHDLRRWARNELDASTAP